MSRVDVMWLPEGWEVEIVDPGGGARGRTLFDEGRILIAPGLHPWQFRATMVHEGIHVERGPVPIRLQAREEAAVNRETARRLIPIREFADALQESDDVRTIAERLEVPPAVVRARWEGLHPSERHFIRRHVGGTA